MTRARGLRSRAGKEALEAGGEEGARLLGDLDDEADAAPHDHPVGDVEGAGVVVAERLGRQGAEQQRAGEQGGKGAGPGLLDGPAVAGKGAGAVGEHARRVVEGLAGQLQSQGREGQQAVHQEGVGEREAGDEDLQRLGGAAVVVVAGAGGKRVEKPLAV